MLDIINKYNYNYYTHKKMCIVQSNSAWHLNCLYS